MCKLFAKSLHARYLQTYIFPVHALSMYKYRDEPIDIPLNWQGQVEDSYRLNA